MARAFVVCRNLYLLYTFFTTEGIQVDKHIPGGGIIMITVIDSVRMTSYNLNTISIHKGHETNNKNEVWN